MPCPPGRGAAAMGMRSGNRQIPCMAGREPPRQCQYGWSRGMASTACLSAGLRGWRLHLLAAEGWDMPYARAEAASVASSESVGSMAQSFH
eukprot:2591208-Alexandrium_andersonii.AAC.1